MDNINLVGNEKGTTAVETAIIIIPLMLLIFGIIEFGLLLYNKQILTNASREGARAGVVIGLDRSGGNNAEYLTVSKNVASRFCANNLVTFGSSNMVPDANYNDLDLDNSPERGEDLIVTLAYDYDWLLLSAFGIPKVSLDVVSIMKLE